MSLLSALDKPRRKWNREDGDFRLTDEVGGLPTCKAGLNGQPLCKYYRKGHEAVPGYRYCLWFGINSHSCNRGGYSDE